MLLPDLSSSRLCSHRLFCGKFFLNLRHSLRRCRQLNRRDKTIALADDSFHKAWAFGIVVQRRACFPDGVINAALGVEKEILTPYSLNNFFARHKLPRP